MIFIEENNSPRRLWSQATSWGGGRPSGSALMESLEVLACLLSFRAAFSKSTITFYWEVQMALRLLGWKVDIIRIPTMYDMNSEMSQVGTEFHVKLKYLSCELSLCVCSRCRSSVNLV